MHKPNIKALGHAVPGNDFEIAVYLYQIGPNGWGMRVA